MNWYITIPAILILLTCIIFITKLSIKVIIFYAHDQRQVLVQVRMWFIRYTFDVMKLFEKRAKKEKPPETKEQEAEEEQERTYLFIIHQLEKLPNLIKTVADMHTILKSFLHTVKVKQLTWSSHLGTGDAASTGIAAGYVWSLKGIIVGVMGQYMQIVHQPVLEVIPVFQGKAAAVQFECRFVFRIGRAMWTGWKLFHYIRKHRSIFMKNTLDLPQQT